MKTPIDIKNDLDKIKYKYAKENSLIRHKLLVAYNLGYKKAINKLSNRIIVKCEHCNGSGYVMDGKYHEDCRKCEGTGIVNK